MIIYLNSEHYKIWVDSKAKEFCFQLKGEDINKARFETAAEAITEADKICKVKN